MGQNFLPGCEKQDRIDFREVIDITFYGEATADHVFNLELYARSLLGFNASFTKVSRELFQCNVNLDIIAETEGSVRASFLVWGTATMAAIGGYSALLGILDYYDVKDFPFKGFKAAIEYIKEAQGEKTRINECLRASGLDAHSIEKFTKIFNNNEFKHAVDELTYCLEVDDIDKITIAQQENSVTILKEERPYFRAQLEDREERQELHDTLSVTNIGRNDKWRFHGSSIKKDFQATIEDKRFLEEIAMFPVSKIWATKFSAVVLIITITEAHKKSPNPPIYIIKKIHMLPFQEKLPTPLQTDE